MVGLEISINGKPTYTIGVGELGVLSATVEWVRLPTKTSIHERFILRASAMAAGAKSPSDATYWQNISVRVGDEVTIRAVETVSHDPPLEGMPDFSIL